MILVSALKAVFAIKFKQTYKMEKYVLCSPKQIISAICL